MPSKSSGRKKTAKSSHKTPSTDSVPDSANEHQPPASEETKALEELSATSGSGPHTPPPPPQVAAEHRRSGESWRRWESMLRTEAAQVLRADEPVEAPRAQPSAHWRDGPETLPRAKDDNPLPAHCCAEVLQADINRSMFHVPEGPRRQLIRRQLCDVIVRALCDERWGGEPLHYYQGVHDVVSVVLDAAAEEKQDNEMDEAEVARLSLVATSLLHGRFRRFAKRDMQATLGALDVMFSIVTEKDPELADKIRTVVGPHAHFAMSWMITWFAHELHDSNHRSSSDDILVAIFDDLIAQPDEFGIVFLCAAVVLRYAPAVVEAHPEWTSDDSYGEAYQALKRLPLELRCAAPRAAVNDRVKTVLEDARKLRAVYGPKALAQLGVVQPPPSGRVRKLAAFAVWAMAVSVTLVAVHLTSQPLQMLT